MQKQNEKDHFRVNILTLKPSHYRYGKKFWLSSKPSDGVATYFFIFNENYFQLWVFIPSPKTGLVWSNHEKKKCLSIHNY